TFVSFSMHGIGQPRVHREVFFRSCRITDMALATSSHLLPFSGSFTEAQLEQLPRIFGLKSV
ncbi:MAG: hypothetical protein O7G13_06945, partial [Alphaproteobacteria bacterium]|nr:hypothetical protein [Alphaproteobacteria bacterium]